MWLQWNCFFLKNEFNQTFRCIKKTKQNKYLNKKKNNIDERFDINFWKPCHRIIYSSSGIINLFRKYNFKIIDWSSIDDFNYRVLSLHNKYGYNKVAELRNSLIKDGNLPELNLFKKILKEALFIKSKALYGFFLFKKEQS